MTFSPAPAAPLTDQAIETLMRLCQLARSAGEPVPVELMARITADVRTGR